jgi:hypothetical protein
MEATLALSDKWIALSINNSLPPLCLFLLLHLSVCVSIRQSSFFTFLLLSIPRFFLFSVFLFHFFFQKLPFLLLILTVWGSVTQDMLEVFLLHIKQAV